MSAEPMIVIGNFNVLCQFIDRLNGTMISDAETVDFEKFRLTTSLVEAKSSCNFYSLSNSSVGDDRVVSRIDKAFVNHTWLMKYNEVIVQYLAIRVSYHSPLIFDMQAGKQEGGRPFRFINALVDHEDFIGVVGRA